MKEYGADLEKSYNDTKSKLIILEAKILKRAKLLCKLSPKTKINSITVAAYYHKYPDAKDSLKNMQVSSLLHIIKTIEKEYVGKSKQGELFEDKS